MINREKIISSIEYYCKYPDMASVHYYGSKIVQMPEKLMRDALALLKAQEPVEPTIGRAVEYDGHDSWWDQCGKCGAPIDPGDKYCRMCGRAVKWE